MFFYILLLFFSNVFCADPIWSQRGKDSKSSSHVKYTSTEKKEWLYRFPNESIPLAGSEIILNPSNGYLSLMGCIGYDNKCYLFVLDAETGKLIDQSGLLDSDTDTFDWETVTPLMDSNARYTFIVPKYRKTNGSWVSSLTQFVDGGQYTFWLDGNFNGANALFWSPFQGDVLIYLVKSAIPYFRYYDIYAIQLNGKNTPSLLWRVPNAFTEDDFSAGSMMMMSQDGYFYFQNQTFGGHPLSYYQKFDVKTGKSVASQNPPVDRIMDTKPILSSTLTPNRVCYTSHSPNGLSFVKTKNTKNLKKLMKKNKKNSYPPSQRFLTCLNSDTLDVLFDTPIPPIRTEVSHWYNYNPSMSLDETEIYVVNGWYPISPTPSTTLYVFGSNDGRVITSHDLGHICETHDVPISVFSSESKFRFVMACIDDDNDNVFLILMDKQGEVTKKKIGDARLVPSKNTINVVTDESDCVYYSFYKELGYFPGYYDVMFAGKSCF